MQLLDHYLPAYRFHERHSLTMTATPAAIMTAVVDYRPADDPLFRRMIGLRELPMRLGARLRGRTAILPPPFGLDNFLLLGQSGNRERAYGLIGRFWRPDFGLITPADPEAYRHFATAGVAKLALGFAITPAGAERATLTTETRVFCPDRATWLKFAPYWYLIRPVSGLIRQRMLRMIRTASEASGA